MLVVAVALSAVVSGSFAPTGMSKKPSSPFYSLPPSAPTQECANVGGCLGVVGPWVVVPPHGDGTFLLRCPQKRGWLIGGTDSRASSHDVRVWYDGELGAPIGSPSPQSSTGAAVLFHATSSNGAAASYSPRLGCVKLRQKGLTSTVSYRGPGAPSRVLARADAAPVATSPAPPLDLHAVVVELYAAHVFYQHVSCLKTEKLVGRWATLAFFAGPPDLTNLSRLVHTTTAISGRQASVKIVTGDPKLFPLGAYPEIQLGVMCQE
jgi:hypothetical protein